MDIVEVINRTCINKVQMSEELANSVIDRYASEGRIIYFYKCKFCLCYHTTSKDHTINWIDIIGGSNDRV